MAFYAWAKVRDKDGKWVQPGDTVTAAKLGIDDDAFKQHVRSGAFRQERYPDIPPGVSPAEYYRQQVAAANAAGGPVPTGE